MTAKDLPAEVCLQIFCLLDKPDVTNCMLVCKNWHSPACLVFYEIITLTKYQIYHIKRLIRKKLLNQDDYFKNLVLTKSLVIKSDKEEYLRPPWFFKDVNYSTIEETIINRSKFESQEFATLISYIPNLHTIDIKESEHFELYVAYLRDLDSTENLMRLEDIKRLEVESYEAVEMDKLCFSTYYNFRNSLTYMVINHSDDLMYGLGGRDGDQISYLPDFICLTHLQLDIRLDSKLTLFDILQNLPHLISLDFYKCRRNPTNIDSSRFTANQQMIQPQQYHNKNKRLKELHLQLPTLSSSYIEYITLYAPDHLETLNITLTATNLYLWMETVGLDNTLMLAKRMGIINNASISWDPMKPIELLPTDQSRITMLFMILNALKGARKLYCRALYVDHASLHDTLKVINNARLDFKYTFNYRNYGGITNGDQVGGSQTRLDKLFEMPLPDIKKTSVGPEVINHLKFILYRVDPRTPYQLLMYALVNCPHLQYFELDSDYGYRIRASPHDHSLKAVKEDPLSSIQANLTKIKFEGFPLYQYFLDLISSHLPNVETLIYTYESKHDRNSVRGFKSSFTFNLTGLENLQVFYFDIQTVLVFFVYGDSSSQGCDYLLLHFKYTDGEEVLYSIENHNDDNYSISLVDRDFYLEYSKSKGINARPVTFKCKKIENFSICYNAHCIGEIHHGQLKITGADDPNYCHYLS